MMQTSDHTAVAEVVESYRDLFLRGYRLMLLARTLDDKLASLYRAGKVAGGVFLGRGQEALSVSIGMNLQKGDVFAPLIRDAAGRLAFGESILDSLRNHLGSVRGPMRGRDGNVHRGHPKQGMLAMISHLGAMISVVNGTLMAHRFQGKKDTVGAVSIGEGGTSTGAFHEALNQAAVEKLPLVLVVANNNYAYSTPSDKQFACRSLVDRAAGYGVTGCAVDGTDLAACLKVLGEAVKRARSGGGPQLVVARLLRLCGHGEHDDATYVSPQLKQSPVGRDCVKVAEEQLLKEQWASESDFSQWRVDSLREVDEGLAQVQQEPGPDPYKEDWCALASRHLMDGFVVAPESA